MVKNLISFIVIVILLINITTVFAGDAHGIFLNDKAAVFFGKVVSYDKTAKTITVIPTQKIKGDVEIGLEQTFEYDYPYADYEFVGGANPVLNNFDEYILEEDAIFVMGYGGYGSGVGIKFTVEPPFDPRLYVFKPTSTDIKTLKIKTWPYFIGCEHELIADQVQMYLNSGVYERAEIERFAKLKQASALQDQKNNSIYMYGAIIVSVLGFIIWFLVLIIKKRTK